MSAFQRLSEALTTILLGQGSALTVHTWWAVSPDTARAVHLCNNGTLILLQRYPVNYNKRMLAKVRTSRDGVALHSSSKVGSAAAAVTHLRLLLRLYRNDLSFLRICLVSFDVRMTQDVLDFWEQHPKEEPPCIEELETNKLLPLISSYVRRQRHVPRALAGVRSIGLMNTVSVDASLEGAKYFTTLDRLDASGEEAVRFLRFLTPLTGLTYLDVSQTAILDQDVLLIAMLPSLRHLDLHHCEGVKDLNLLRRSDTLQWLNARGCMHLTRFSGVGYVPTLQFLDLSDNHLGAAEFTVLLESPLPAEHVLLQRVRFPREPLRNDILVMPNIKYLNLSGADLGLHMEVLSQLGPVEELVLDGSTVTAAALEQLAPCWGTVRVLWLLRLDTVRLSCQFALAMGELTILHIWRRSLQSEDDIEMLQSSGISVILYDH